MDIGVEINQQYQIVEHIGRGGMADVWSARDQKLNRMVAIKTIAHGLSAELDPVALFKREAQTIAQMEHPHILPIYDFGEFESSLYIVMRYVTGGALSDKLQGDPLPVDFVLRLGTAIAQALDYAHANNIVHLDLKPQNILLDRSKSPYLADFGLATVMDREGRALNPGSGTLMYMAPEQMTSEVIDHRADIYSFGVMLYHMLNGRLPFDGLAPLSIKQLQFGEDLPLLTHLPADITHLLRRNTANNPEDRPARVLDIIEDIQAVLSDSIDLSSAAPLSVLDAHEDGFIDSQTLETTDADLLEAVDIYSRARHVWAGGQGRFLLGITHFMLMSSYYTQAERFGLTLDDEGRQMLLRGALEYDRDIAHWWDQLDDVNRRWVCLHAMRSANAPARIRALYHVETLPDFDPPRIPKLVAQTLQEEVDPQAQIAALQVLATRARLIKPSTDYNIQTQYQGKMISTLTRLELQAATPPEWHEFVYNAQIDTLLAQIALDPTRGEIADFAARVIGRIRSKTAVRYLAKHQWMPQTGALRALALVRDEAHSLPPVVSRAGRAYAWLANTWRRLSDNPLAMTWRFLFAVLGGWLAMGWQVYSTFRSEAILAPDRIANTLSFGLAFGFFVGVMVLLADEIPSRLRGFWKRWARGVLALSLGVAWGTLTWGLSTWMYLRTTPNWDLMFFGGFGLSLGFVLTALLNLRGWLAVLLTAAATFLTIYAPFNNYCRYLGTCAQSPAFSVAPAAWIGLALGVIAGVVLYVRTPQPDTPANNRAPILLGAGAGIVWTAATWALYVATLDVALLDAAVFAAQTPALQWASVVGFTCFGIASGIAACYLLPRSTARGAFILTATAAFFAILWTLNPLLTQVPGFAPEGWDALLYYDVNAHYWQTANLMIYDRLFTSGIPFALLVALGGHAMALLRDFKGRNTHTPPAPLPPMGLEAITGTDTPTSAPIATQEMNTVIYLQDAADDLTAPLQSPRDDLTEHHPK